MQSGNGVHISAAEWRWVTTAAVLLVLLAFVPYLLLALSDLPADGWQFMGILNNHRDGATYLSKMALGANGQWLVRFQHTPEPHGGALIQVIYPLLGQVSGLTGVPSLILFHVTRVIATILMYMAIYHLGASIWMRLRARRLFFAMAVLAAGFGWLYVLATGDVSVPDISVPEAFPFYSSLVNVHFPLALACLALLVSILIAAFRPGEKADPDLHNGGLLGMLLSLALALLYPQVLVPLGLALAIYVLINAIRTRTLAPRELRWMLVVFIPAVPFALNYLLVVMANPVMMIWNQQNITEAPSPPALLIGLGLPLLIALPGIIRAVRRFEGDGDRLMLLWLAAMLIAIYLPTNVQRRFAAGMMLPVAYFAARALEDYWFERFNRRWRQRLFLVLLPVMMLSNLFVLFTPLLPVLINQPGQSAGIFLERDYALAFGWLRGQASLSDVVLASPTVSVWIPGWAEARVVYGHPYETIDATAKEAEVLDWYGGQCGSLLADYGVDYVLYGPREMALGDTTCLEALRLIEQIGSVGIYAP